MTRGLRGILVLAFVTGATGACSSGGGQPGGSVVSSGGSGGVPAVTGGSSGSGVDIPGGGTPTGGTGGAPTGEGKVDASPPATGGTSAVDGSAAAETGGGDGSQPVTMGEDLGWYEAENGVISGRATRFTCQAACPATPPIKSGDSCCSGGKRVDWLVSSGNGELQFNNVMVPSEGTYDVTWWYYCGKNDNFGDKNCGGQTNPPTTAAGCRPHQFLVNGTPLTGYYHFPCFGSTWQVVHVATVAMPLKAGPNTIKLHPPGGRDSVNVDAIELYPSGKGLPPLIMSNTDPKGH
jgi:hypothetical protein